MSIRLGETILASHGGVKPLDFSLEEQDTGRRWVDGKKIYQKTYLVTSTTHIHDTAYTNSGLTITNGDTLISVTVRDRKAGSYVARSLLSGINLQLAFSAPYDIVAGGSVTAEYTCIDR